MTTGEVRVPRTATDWEAEVSAWCWRGAVAVVVLLVFGRVAVDPTTLPFGTDLWPQWALTCARVLALGGVAKGLHWLLRTIGALTILLGTRPLVRVSTSDGKFEIALSQVLGRARLLHGRTGESLTIFQVNSPKFEHRGKGVRAVGLFDWQLRTSEGSVEGEVPWPVDSDVRDALRRVLEPAARITFHLPLESPGSRAA